VTVRMRADAALYQLPPPAHRQAWPSSNQRRPAAGADPARRDDRDPLAASHRAPLPAHRPGRAGRVALLTCCGSSVSSSCRTLGVEDAGQVLDGRVP
jgi:hypothetical protein